MSLLVGFTTVLIFICGNCMFYGYYWSNLAADGLGTSTVVDENWKSSWFKVYEPRYIAYLAISGSERETTK